MRRRGFTFWQLLAILTLVTVAALILFPIFARVRGGRPEGRYSCQSNLKQIGLGVMQYCQDWDEKFPIVNVKDTNINEQNPLGWADALQPYIKSTALFRCPTKFFSGEHIEGEKKSPSERDYTDYFYNRRLNETEIKELANTPSTVLFGEGNDGSDAANARYSLAAIPDAWLKDKNSPIYRHLEGANYAFADGHVKWMKPDKITDKKPDGNTYTFAVK